MKTMCDSRSLVSTLLAMTICALPIIGTAKSINIYAEPNEKSKLVETMNADNGVITIFQPKNSIWIKVADPQNGNVGWMKASDLTNAQFNLKIIQSNTSPHHYQVIQYGNVPPENNQSIAMTIEQMEKRQQMLQKEMQQNMQNMFKLMHDQWAQFPIIVPVVKIEEKKPQPTTTHTSKATTPIKQDNKLQVTPAPDKKSHTNNTVEPNKTNATSQ